MLRKENKYKLEAIDKPDCFYLQLWKSFKANSKAE